LDIQADVVVLSACETGVNEVGGGDEIIGLTRAFLAAGAKSLVHSLWPVFGTSTKELMVTFHNNLLQGQSKMDALRNAQLDMLHTDRFKKPFHWAPFVLVGDWH
jgi:CHAT domain-containing protein